MAVPLAHTMPTLEILAQPLAKDSTLSMAKSSSKTTTPSSTLQTIAWVSPSARKHRLSCNNRLFIEHRSPLRAYTQGKSTFACATCNTSEQHSDHGARKQKSPLLCTPSGSMDMAFFALFIILHLHQMISTFKLP